MISNLNGFKKRLNWQLVLFPKQKHQQKLHFCINFSYISFYNFERRYGILGNEVFQNPWCWRCQVNFGHQQTSNQLPVALIDFPSNTPQRQSSKRLVATSPPVCKQYAGRNRVTDMILVETRCWCTKKFFGVQTWRLNIWSVFFFIIFCYTVTTCPGKQELSWCPSFTFTVWQAAISVICIERCLVPRKTSACWKKPLLMLRMFQKNLLLQ